MTRVPLIDSSDDPKTQALIDRLKKGRRGNLLGIYKALLHNGRLAETWFEHLNAVRWETDLSGRLREILIIRIGWRLDCGYIMRQHIPKLARPEGLSDEDCDALLQNEISTRFPASEQAAMRLADELTVSAKASDDTVAAIKAHFNDRQFVEMTVLIGTYNMHARFVAGLNIALEKD